MMAIWTFLTKPRGKASPRRRKRQRGIALVTVLIAIAITLVISNQFGTSTNVDMIAAANYRDQMRAHFRARSAVDLSELVIRLQQRIDNIKALVDQGKSEEEVLAAKPTAEFDAAWGKGFMNAENFTKFSYQSLKR